MEFLDTKTPQVEFDNIHALILAWISNNKGKPLKVNECGAIAANDEAADIFYIFWFLFVPYTFQKDVVSDRNQIKFGDLVCHTIYTSTGQHKSCFCINLLKEQKSVTVSMNTVDLPNIGVKICTPKGEFPQGNFLCSLT